MASADAMRASDKDRELIVAALQEQVGEGRLTLVEFEERSGEAYEAKTVGELRALMHDLPTDPLAPPLMPWQQPMGMPPVPPWAQQQMPMYHRSLPPGKRGGSGMGGLGLIMLIALLVVPSVVAVSAQAAFFLPLLPLFIVLMVLRPGRRSH